MALLSGPPLMNVFIDAITLLRLFDIFKSYYRFYETLVRYHGNVILIKGRVFYQQEDLRRGLMRWTRLKAPTIEVVFPL